MRPLVVLSILIVALVAGCTGSPADQDSDDAAPDTPQHAATTPIFIPGNATHCKDTVAFFTDTPAAYQAHLPPNWTTRDAKALVDEIGLPVATGQAAAYVSAYECPESGYADGGPLAGGEIAILVEPPTLDNASAIPDTATLDFFLLTWHTDNATHGARMDALGIPHLLVNLVAGVGGPPVLHESAPAVMENQTLLFSLRSNAPESGGYTGHVRIWHENGHGIGYIDLHFQDAPNGKGPVSECTFRSGTVYAELFGTDCDGRPGVALLFYDQTYTGGFRFLPGVHTVG